MKKEFSLFVVLFAVMFAATPVGICPCWLDPDVESIHPHFADPEIEHSHEYLSQMSQGAAFSPAFFIAPSVMLLTALAAGMLWKLLFAQVISGSPWSARPPLPPPKALSKTFNGYLSETLMGEMALRVSLET